MKKVEGPAPDTGKIEPAAKKPVLELPPTKDDKFDYVGWNFNFSKGPMMTVDQITELETKLNLQYSPSVIFGNTFGTLLCQERDFVYSINPIDMLRFTDFEHRKASLLVDYKDPSADLETINVLPDELKVAAAEHWAKRRMRTDAQGEKIEQLEHRGDWTFSSPYKGSIRQKSLLDRFSSPFHDWSKMSKDFLERAKEEKGEYPVSIQQTEEKIPFDRLGKENKIIFFTALNLYEDDLEDSGFSQASMKFRVMKDCFYAFIRSYVRIDNVMVRSIETRIFHDFTTDHILRQFSLKEASYDDLKAKGLEFTAQFNNDPHQADIISQHLKEVFTLTDRVNLPKSPTVFPIPSRESNAEVSKKPSQESNAEASKEPSPSK